MEVVLENSNMKLIVKYNNYYIRFNGGQYVELPCDVRINNEDASEIIREPSYLIEVFEKYRKNITWTMETFLRSGLTDFIRENSSMTNQSIDLFYGRLSKHEDIKYEMYEYAMTEVFPTSSAVKVNGRTAQQICEEEKVEPYEAYLCMVELRGTS